MSDTTTRAGDQPGQALTAERRREIEALPTLVHLGRMQCGELADAAVTATLAIRELLDALDAATGQLAVTHQVFYDWSKDLDEAGQHELAHTVLRLLLVEHYDFDAATPPVPSGVSGEGGGDGDETYPCR